MRRSPRGPPRRLAPWAAALAAAWLGAAQEFQIALDLPPDMPEEYKALVQPMCVPSLQDEGKGPEFMTALMDIKQRLMMYGRKGLKVNEGCQFIGGLFSWIWELDQNENTGKKVAEIDRKAMKSKVLEAITEKYKDVMKEGMTEFMSMNSDMLDPVMTVYYTSKKAQQEASGKSREQAAGHRSEL